MIATLILLAAQATAVPLPAAPSTKAAGAPERFSILVDPCASAQNDHGNDIVVCGHPEVITPRLPLRDFRGPPDHPVPSNPEMSAAVALNGKSARGECGAYGEACPVGMGGYALPALVNGAAGLVKDAFAKHPHVSKANRVSIPMDDLPPEKPAP